MIPDNSLWLWALLFAAVTLSTWLEHTRIGHMLSAPVIAVSWGALLANLGVIPTASSSYDAISSYVVPTAIPLLLMRGNLRRIVRESGVTLYAFLLGSLCTVIASLVAFWIVPMNKELAAKLAGAFAATYIGGSMNFVVVSQAVGITGETFAAAVAADNIVTTLYIVVLALIPTFSVVQRIFRAPAEATATTAVESSADEPTPFRPIALTGGIALALVIAGIGVLVGQLTGIKYAPILVSTVVTVALVTSMPSIENAFPGSFEVGLAGMLLFFVTVGAGANIAALVDSGVLILLYAAVIVTLHVVLILPLAAALRLPMREVIMGSCSNITGPGVSAAVAASRGWKDLVIPGVLTGILGYIIANFIGIALTKALS